MLGNHILVVVGNLTADPELKFSEGGTPFAKFSIAVNDGKRDDPKAKKAFYRCTAFNGVAENVAETLHRGDSVLALLRIDPWEREIQTEDGVKTIQQIDYTVDEIGPSLRFASAKIARNEHGNSNDRGDDRGDDREERSTTRSSGRSGSTREERTEDRGDDREQRTPARGGSQRTPARSGSSRGRGDNPNF